MGWAKSAGYANSALNPHGSVIPSSAFGLQVVGRNGRKQTEGFHYGEIGVSRDLKRSGVNRREKVRHPLIL